MDRRQREEARQAFQAQQRLDRHNARCLKKAEREESKRRLARRRQLRLLLDCPTGRLPTLTAIRRQGGPPALIAARLAAREELRRGSPKLPKLRRTQKPEAPKGRWLYRAFAANDRLLYVGITDRGHRREREHARTKSWWPEVHHVTYEPVATRAELEHRERQAIWTERPKYNIQHRRR